MATLSRGKLALKAGRYVERERLAGLSVGKITYTSILAYF